MRSQHPETWPFQPITRTAGYRHWKGRWHDKRIHFSTMLSGPLAEGRNRWEVRLAILKGSASFTPAEIEELRALANRIAGEHVDVLLAPSGQSATIGKEEKPDAHLPPDRNPDRGLRLGRGRRRSGRRPEDREL
jgi:hypothetical protein